jgi:uncharacterized membrane protein
MGVANIPGQNLTWQMRSCPNGLYSVQNKGKPMQLRRKMKKKARMMMVPGTATATNIAKPALLPQPANYMRVSTAMFTTIGFTLLALAGKFMAMLLYALQRSASYREPFSLFDPNIYIPENCQGFAQTSLVCSTLYIVKQ